MNFWEQNLGVIIQIITLMGVVFAIYKGFKNPQVSDEKDIALLKQACKLRHIALDENISSIRTNHLAHIESDIRELRNGQIRIVTILDERLPLK